VESPRERIYLSPPRATEADIEAVTAAMRSGWLAPVGPDLARFEEDMAQFLGIRHAVGLASGTAALHLGMRYLGVAAGDAVLVPTVTFGATAFAVTYLGAVPVFLDMDESWNMDPALVEKAVTTLRAYGTRVSAAVPVDLYGAPADYGTLLPLLDSLDVPVLEDAAEGLGASSGDDMVGSFGTGAVLSFNGNKLITTSGGGMLVTDDADFADRVRFWSTQSREPEPWYEHREIGFNYRLSNLLGALGHSQLRRVPDEVAKRRQIREWYRERLTAVPGVVVQSDPTWGQSNAWLTVARFSPSEHPAAPTRVRELLERHNVESRPVWKPMHQQPVFADNPAFLTGAADALFADGLCLPSGTILDESDIDWICSLVISCLRP
jgi:dTDP-4-amino-4,6-dideoxygalactose transaminase